MDAPVELTDPQRTVLERARDKQPFPVADAIAALLGAGDAAAQAVGIVAAFRCVVHFLAVVGLAARAERLPAPADEPAEVARKLSDLVTKGHLTEGQWLVLLREMLRPYARQPDAHPVPELVSMFHARAALRDVHWQALQRLRNRLAHEGRGELPWGSTEDDEPGPEIDLPPSTTELVSAGMDPLCAVLGALETLWSHRQLVMPRADRDGAVRSAWNLMGMTAHAAGRQTVHRFVPEGGDLEPSIVSDAAESRRTLRLAPFACAPSADRSGPRELFLLAERDGEDAVYVARSGERRTETDGWAGVAAKLGLGASTQAPARPPGVERPFRGLASFEAKHEALFHGRRQLIDALVNTIQEQRLLMVTGASASGKTSLLQAGVLPVFERMERQHLRETERAWMVVLARPLRDPVGEVARAVEEGVRAAPGTDDDTPRGHAGDVVEMLRAAVERLHRRILLVVDQAEEVFTLSPDDAVAHAAFARTMAAAAAVDGVHVLLVARDDYALRLRGLEGLGVVPGEEPVFLVGAPSREELKETLRAPAAAFECAFDDGLLEEMVETVAAEPAALALLQFTADQLWERREDGRLTRDAYRDLGGVEGSLARHADRLLEGDDGDPTPVRARQQAVMRELLLRMVSDEGTRRPVTMADLPDALDAGDARAVLKRLVDGRLVVERGAKDSGEPMFELVHEALVARWPKMVEWRREDRDRRPMQRDLTQAARRWADSGRKPDYLWHGQRVDQLARWRAAPMPPVLARVEAEFADASARQARRGRWLARGGVSAAMVVLAVFAGTMFVLRRQAQAERDRTRRTLGRAYLSAARLEQERFLFDKAQALAGAALEHGEDGGLDVALPAILRTAGRSVRTYVGLPHDSVTAVAPSHDGHLVAAATFGGDIMVWATTSRRITLRAKALQTINALAFSPDDRWLVAEMQLGGLLRFDLRAPQHEAENIDWPEIDHGTSSVALSEDARRVAYVNGCNQLRVWDIERRQDLGRLVDLPERTGRDIAASEVDLSADGKRVAMAYLSAEQQTLYVGVWDVERMTELRRWQLPNPGGATAVLGGGLDLGSDGRTLAVGIEGTVHVLAVGPGVSPGWVPPPRGLDGELFRVGGSAPVWDDPRDRLIVSSNGDRGIGGLASYAPSRGYLAGPVVETPLPADTRSVEALEERGQALFVGGPGGLVRRYELTSAVEPEILLREPWGFWGPRAEIAADGRTLVYSQDEGSSDAFGSVTVRGIVLRAIDLSSSARTQRSWRIAGSIRDTSIAASRNPLRIAVGYVDRNTERGQVAVVDLVSGGGSPRILAAPNNAEPGSVAFSDDGRWLAILGGRSASIIDPASGEVHRRFGCEHSTQVLWLAGGVLGCLNPRGLALWSRDGRPQPPLRFEPSLVQLEATAAVARDAAVVAAILRDGGLWSNAPGFGRHGRVSPAGAEPRRIALSPDGQLAAVDSQAGPQIWDLRRSRLLFQLEGHDGPSNVLGFTDAGRALVAGYLRGAGQWVVVRWRLRPIFDAQSALRRDPASVMRALGYRVDGSDVEMEPSAPMPNLTPVPARLSLGQLVCIRSVAPRRDIGTARVED